MDRRRRQGDGGYTLAGTAGQPEAAVWSGGRYTLAGGSWAVPVEPAPAHIYLPVVIRS